VIWQPRQHLSKMRLMGFPENVLVGYQAPHEKRLSASLLYIGDFVVWNEVLDSAEEDVGLVSAQNSTVRYEWFLGQWISKVRRDWYCHDLRFDFATNFSSWAIARVYEIRSSLKSKVSLSFASTLLKYTRAYGYSQVCTHDGLIAFVDNGRDL